MTFELQTNDKQKKKVPRFGMYKKNSQTTKWRNKKKELEKKKSIRDCRTLEEIWGKKELPRDDHTVDSDLQDLTNTLPDLELFHLDINPLECDLWESAMPDMDDGVCILHF